MSLAIAYTPRPSSLYGRLIAAVDVEQAFKARIDDRLDDYLNEVERQHGLAVGTLERPRAYVDDERFVEDQLPAIVVKSPGTADLPAADGHGRYTVRFELELEAHVAAAAGVDERWRSSTRSPCGRSPRNSRRRSLWASTGSMNVTAAPSSSAGAPTTSPSATSRCTCPR